ncbi:uncharacterized protein BJ212DRAFT_478098 [Suillus subaureus]|uniref:Uncharacterized protein n=1 Tax=Suillus subaureus TaxID=48587 RepID=A0A9P7JB60_9AGAM|nr:uncharacterized protein BJ212DRAFT_478098 [Suillus subaureus]KAG1812198.1 hypothetical protein BJ212DRAFT_478098 [Suillus subaureus]
MASRSSLVFLRCDMNLVHQWSRWRSHTRGIDPRTDHCHICWLLPSVSVVWLDNTPHLEPFPTDSSPQPLHQFNPPRSCSRGLPGPQMTSWQLGR